MDSGGEIYGLSLGWEMRVAHLLNDFLLDLSKTVTARHDSERLRHGTTRDDYGTARLGTITARSPE
jgi:hypothetical protein